LNYEGGNPAQPPLQALSWLLQSRRFSESMVQAKRFISSIRTLLFEEIHQCDGDGVMPCFRVFHAD